MFGTSYHGKRVLVTGHTGFKGSWLALWLHELGAQITGLALPPSTNPSHFGLIRLEDLVNHLEGDIRDLETVRRAFTKARPEIVFHLAAQPLVHDSYQDPKTTFDTNIGGTVNILEAIRHCPTVEAAVIITSDKCYENQEWVWGYRENDSMGGNDPYSASKGATEIVCSSYLRSFFRRNGLGPHVGVATARAGNVIGGGDWATDRIIPDCVRALSTDRPILIRNPEATRPWQHVLDPIAGYLLLAVRLVDDREKYCGAWNFGPQTTRQISVRELASRFVAAWGAGSIQTPNSNERSFYEARLLHLNIDKAVSALQWQPVLEGATAIDWTAAWYKFWHLAKENLRELSVSQIHQFVKTAQQTRISLL